MSKNRTPVQRAGPYIVEAKAGTISANVNCRPVPRASPCIDGGLAFNATDSLAHHFNS